jgi:multiple sugar transport system ATP-binding protein
MRLAVRGISKRFGDIQALDGVEFEVPDGSFFVIVGPSGAGKTTTLRVVAGLEQPDEGDVLFDGIAVGKATPAERDLAMVFQSYALHPKMTALANIAAPLRARRVDKDELQRLVREVAELLGIEPLLARRPAQLSGGEQQRVALARALVRSPRAYLMDEPLTNLDLQLRVATRTELVRIQRNLRRTFLYVTNDQVEAMSMANRIAVLREGRIQQIGTPDEIYNRPANRFVASFVGSPRMNLLPCRVEAGSLRGEGGWTLPMPMAAHGDGRPLLLGIRPEDISVGRGNGASVLDGSVFAVEPLGDRSLVDVEIGGALVKIRARPTASFEVGESVRAVVNLERVHLFDAETEEALR